MSPSELRPERQRDRIRWFVWLGCAIVIWAVGWGIYALVLSFYNFDLFSSTTAHGGRLNSVTWAGIVGPLCALPAAFLACRLRRKLPVILFGFVLAYVLALLAFWHLSAVIWGPVRYAYDAAEAGETACWKQLPGLTDLPYGEVEGLGAGSATDVWAVGQDSDRERSLTVHWDGNALRQVASPGKQELVAVSVVSPTEAWAAGGTSAPLVEHWNGTIWRVLPTPHLPKARFMGVAALSTYEAWAVGSVDDTRTHRSRPLIEHWNGQRWSVAFRGNRPGRLRGIAVRAPDDAWAVGRQAGRALIQHWDGRAWRRIVRASAEMRGSLNGVVVFGTTSAWAVGASAGQPLVQHWDGRRWRVVRAVSHRQTGALWDIAAVSPTDIWASGASGSTPLLEQWNGRRWRTGPVPKLHVGFSALEAVSATEIWGDLNESGGFFTPVGPFIERSSCSA
jgi:hypothetical protein